jgi:hypothetical protein
MNTKMQRKLSISGDDPFSTIFDLKTFEKEQAREFLEDDSQFF